MRDRKAVAHSREPSGVGARQRDDDVVVSSSQSLAAAFRSCAVQWPCVCELALWLAAPVSFPRLELLGASSRELRACRLAPVTIASKG